MTSGNEITTVTSRQMARRQGAAPAAVSRVPAKARTARWSRRRGVLSGFAAFAVLGFAAAYVGPIGFALTEAEAVTVPVTIYADTIADVQRLDAAGAVGAPVTLDRDNYTVYVTPTPTPTPTPVKKASVASGSSGSSGGGWSVPFVTPDPGSAQAIAYEMVLARGWGDDQFACLVALWNRESGWRVNAYNKGSGAYGIPQSLPGSKMASAGADWETNPATQIAWGLGYIGGRYGSPCGAWAHSERVGWY